MARVGSTAFVVPTSESEEAVPLKDVFVSVDLEANVANVVCKGDFCGERYQVRTLCYWLRSAPALTSASAHTAQRAVGFAPSINGGA